MKRIALYTSFKKDDIETRRELESIAFGLNGNLNGFSLDKEKNVIYFFEFSDESKLEKFKEEEAIKQYKTLKMKKNKYFL
jgi:hypothetical protein